MKTADELLSAVLFHGEDLSAAMMAEVALGEIAALGQVLVDANDCRGDREAIAKVIYLLSRFAEAAHDAVQAAAADERTTRIERMEGGAA